jgi:hypothetical protein
MDLKIVDLGMKLETKKYQLDREIKLKKCSLSSFSPLLLALTELDGVIIELCILSGAEKS